MDELVGQGLHVVGTCPRVDLLADLGLVLDVDLGVAGNTSREVGGQRDGLVEGVGVERLGVSQHGCHGLDTGAAHIVEWILLGERPARCLGVGAQSERLRILGSEALHNLGPQETSCTHLGNLHEVVHADGPEEREARSERIDVDACVDTCAEVVHTVGEGVGQLDVGSGTCFLHVVAGDGDGVELRHLLRSVLEDVGDNLHGECWWVNVGVTHHELLQDVVLDGSGHLLELCALFQTCVDVEGEDGEHGTVHGHGHGHLVQWDAIEEHLHVLEGTDGYACLADVTHDARIVGVVTTVSGEVERH